MSVLNTPKGTRDLIGEELETVRKVEAIVRRIFINFGYREIETPVFENLELFTKKSGSEIIRQLYSFKDKSGNSLVLRPELTAPAIRLYIQNFKSDPKPVKLCYFGNCFRYEEPQAWRWRQFSQTGAEIIGSQKPEADVEVVLTASEIMKQLGFKHWQLNVGDVGLLRKALSKAGVGVKHQDPILRAVDSRDEKRISAEIKKAGVDNKSVEELKRLFSLSGDPNVIDEIPTADVEEFRRFKEIVGLLSSVGVDFSLNLGIARGLDYYSGFVFEIYVDGVQVAGGGRYDNLVEVLGGPPTPATGVGFGVDRLSRALLEMGIKPKSTRPQIMVIPVSGSDIAESFRVALILRRAGIPTNVELASGKLQKALGHAHSMGVKRAVIIGSKERTAGEVLLRDMSTGKQERLKPEHLVSKLKGAS